MGKTAIIIGSTGLVGSSLTAQIQHTDSFSKVYLFVREKTERSFSKKIEEVSVDFESENTFPAIENVDALFCCLGTTIKKAGSQENFKKVDLEYVVRAADCYQKRGAKHFLVISAVGANDNSNFFYNRVKGQMEKAVLNLGYPKVSIFRPAMLGGNRKEFRFGEWMGSIILKGIQWMFFGKMKRYKIIDAKNVARTMIDYAIDSPNAMNIIESEQMQYS